MPDAPESGYNIFTENETSQPQRRHEHGESELHPGTSRRNEVPVCRRHGRRGTGGTAGPFQEVRRRQAVPRGRLSETRARPEGGQGRRSDQEGNAAGTRVPRSLQCGRPDERDQGSDSGPYRPSAGGGSRYR